MTFRHKSSLSRHNKIHNKLTKCHLCNRTFRYESFLKKHLLTAHKTEDGIHQPPNSSIVPRFDEGEEKSDECYMITYEPESSQKYVHPEEPQNYYQQPAVVVNNLHHQYAS